MAATTKRIHFALRELLRFSFKQTAHPYSIKYCTNPCNFSIRNFRATSPSPCCTGIRAHSRQPPYSFLRRLLYSQWKTTGSEESKTEKLKGAELTNEKKEEPQPVEETIREEDVKWLLVCAKVKENRKQPPPPLLQDEWRGFWDVEIDVHTGLINDWPKGTAADISIEVSKYNYYAITDEKMEVFTLLSKAGYVLPCLGDAYSDYVKVKVNKDGQIQGWNFNLNDCIKDSKTIREKNVKWLDVSAKVRDTGCYDISDEKGNILLSKDGYAPSCFGLGSGGSYIDLRIDKDGMIQGWDFNLKHCLKEFAISNDS